MIRSSVVLPEPDGPSIVKNSPRRDVEIDAGDSLDAAVGLPHPAQAHGRRRRPGARSGCAPSGTGATGVLTVASATPELSVRSRSGVRMRAAAGRPGRSGDNIQDQMIFKRERSPCAGGRRHRGGGRRAKSRRPWLARHRQRSPLARSSRRSIPVCGATSSRDGWSRRFASACCSTASGCRPRAASPRNSGSRSSRSATRSRRCAEWGSSRPSADAPADRSSAPPPGIPRLAWRRRCCGCRCTSCATSAITGPRSRAPRRCSPPTARSTRTSSSLREHLGRLRAAEDLTDRRRADARLHIEIAAAAQSPRLTREEIALWSQVGDLLWLPLCGGARGGRR